MASKTQSSCSFWLMYLFAAMVTHSYSLCNSGLAQMFPFDPNLDLWTTTGNAAIGQTGGLAPWNLNKPLDPTAIIIANETVLPLADSELPFEGSNMIGIAYSGSDSIISRLGIPSNVGANTEFEIFANAIQGTIDGQPFMDGEFQLFYGEISSPVFQILSTDGWNAYRWRFTLPPGPLSNRFGVRTLSDGNYAIAFTSFYFVFPEPNSFCLISIGLVATALHRYR